MRGVLASVLAMMGIGNMVRSGAVQEMPAMPKKTAVAPYVDKAGMPHGHVGDKLVRKAMTGTVGLTHSRGPLWAWASASVAKGYRHGRRPGYSKTRSL